MTDDLIRIRRRILGAFARCCRTAARVSFSLQLIRPERAGHRLILRSYYAWPCPSSSRVRDLGQGTYLISRAPILRANESTISSSFEARPWRHTQAIAAGLAGVSVESIKTS